MKFRITEIIKDYEGRPTIGERVKRDAAGKAVKDSDGKNSIEEYELTVRDVVNTCTASIIQDETAEDKNKLYPIGIKIWGGEEVDLTAEQIALVIKRVEKLYGSMVLGRCREFFDRPLEGGGKEKESL